MGRQNPSSILIVDDNSKNLQVLADILRSRNYKVATAKDGPKALSFIGKRKPDLILLDIMMPDMDGFEVCRRLKADPATREIPVIFISALTDIMDKVRGFEVGGVDYITKPFQKEEVFARVNAHLNLKRVQEDLMEANNNLRSANAAKDKLFSIIAHDLRGPLGTLSGILDLWADRFRKMEDLDNQWVVIDELRKRTRGTYDLLENLLCWADSQRGTIVYQPQLLNLAKVVRSVVNTFSAAAEDKSIHLQAEIDTSFRVFADVDMLMIVIRNLISNALKFTNEFGKVSVKAATHGDLVDITVQDTGIGIPQKDIQRLFHLEDHYTTQGTRNEKGSGLGLLLCKEFVDRNRGKIDVKSRESKGSIFTISLPVKPAD